MKHMKNILTIILIAFIFISCSDPNQFVIEGQFDNGGKRMVYLDKLGQRQLEPIDSIAMDENGNFKFKGQIEQPNFFVIRVEEEMITLLVEPSEKVKLKGTIHQLADGYEVEGSVGSVQVKKLNTQLGKTMEQIDSIRTTYRKALADSSINMDSLKPGLDKKYAEILEKQKQKNIAFIEENPGSMASILALYQQVGPRTFVLNPTENMEYFEMVNEKLSQKYPNSPQVQSLGNFIVRNKQELEKAKNEDARLGIGAEAPDIALPNPQGDTITLSSLRGNYVLLDFWAAWCRPCRAENPTLVANYKKYNPKGFEIYQVSLDRTKDAWVQAIKSDNLTWHHVSDLQYWNSAPAKVYNVQGIPANFLLDPEGIIIAKNLRGQALGNKLEEIYNQPQKVKK